jgi:glycerophosphoryl diester phosphodiesterase
VAIRVNHLVAFLAERAGSRRVMVSSRDPNALLYLHGHLPDVILLFSVAGPDAVHQLQSDPALQKAIGGVSVFQGLADVDLVTWVHQHKLLILAWTVNDSQRLNQLVRLGVDGITTGNLAILRASGNQRRRGAPRKVVCVPRMPSVAMNSAAGVTMNASPHRRRGISRDSAASHSRSPGW